MNTQRGAAPQQKNYIIVVFLAPLHGCGTRSVVLKEEYRLSALENCVQWNVFDSKGKE